ncbi:PIF1-like helicase [Medicago truncatula]|uniref:ATP-dependent DNA helicase n=1 Tax=Medicago truncatula TaxID=3880 RepID=G7I499_MEDTR|nr:PIF1-like helicase [Medicago truncatula]
MDVVEHVNEFILSLVPRDEKEYISYDSVCKQTRIMRYKASNYGFGKESGDFRQILPVIRKGCRQDILASSINSSKLWRHCKVRTLTTNMSLRASTVRAEQDEIRKFVDLMLSIGDGIRSANESGEINVLIPDELLIKEIPLIRYENEYINFDFVCESDESSEIQSEWFTHKFLNNIKFSDISNHKLRFKVGCPVMLMRNIDQETGLCNWTRLIVDNIWKNFIDATVITKKNDGEKVIIPRMNLFPSDPKLPFKLTTRHFPVSLEIYLSEPVFTHGQLYVAVSRITFKMGLKMLILDEENLVCTETTNVVYRDIFRNV